jgi:predicted nucleic acid-binding Zn ribbon protein
MQSFKAENQRKTALLLILFPVSLVIIFWIVLSLFFTETGSWEE